MRVFRKLVPLRWGDMDAMNHLNNTMYFRLMEEARIAWFNEQGMFAGPHGEGPILASASCDFLKPMTYPSTAVVTQTITRVGRSSMELELVIEDDADAPVTYAKGKNVLVWMNYDTGKSAPWPEHVRALLDGI